MNYASLIDTLPVKGVRKRKEKKLPIAFYVCFLSASQHSASPSPPWIKYLPLLHRNVSVLHTQSSSLWPRQQSSLSWHQQTTQHRGLRWQIVGGNKKSSEPKQENNFLSSATTKTHTSRKFSKYLHFPVKVYLYI